MSKMDRSYAAVTGRKSQIIRDAIGVDYSKYEKEGIIFDYEALMADTGYTLEDHIRIQQEYNVGKIEYDLRVIGQTEETGTGVDADDTGGGKVITQKALQNAAGNRKCRTLDRIST